MGGISEIRLVNLDGFARFEGRVSLENNGALLPDSSLWQRR